LKIANTSLPMIDLIRPHRTATSTRPAPLTSP
jgi:hypothetical protein